MDARYPIHVTYHKAKSGVANKMDQMVSINTDTYHNEFCQRMSKVKGSVCSVCYAMRLSRLYGKKSMAPFERNGRLLNSDLEDWQLPRLNVAFCRLHSFGELESNKHFLNLVRICKTNPQTEFALWTKRPGLVDVQLTPSNLVLVHSTLMIDGRPVIPKGFHKAFTVYTMESNVALNCWAKSCFSCLKCYRRDSGEVYIKEKLR
jgi:hypothetical protein